jgi:hypothetical protein
MSEELRLYRRHVTADGLEEAVGAFKDKLKYLYFESEATIELMDYRPPEPAWTHGRAFGPELEVRWQRVRDGFELLLLSEQLPQPPGWEPVAGGTPLPPDSADPPGQVLLWGTHISQLQQPHHLAGGQGDAWIETRIPRPLEYPVSGAPRWVKARVVVYRCQGRPVLTRLVSLEGEKDEPQPLW